MKHSSTVRRRLEVGRTYGDAAFCFAVGRAWSYVGQDNVVTVTMAYQAWLRCYDNATGRAYCLPNALLLYVFRICLSTDENC